MSLHSLQLTPIFLNFSSRWSNRHSQKPFAQIYLFRNTMHLFNIILINPRASIAFILLGSKLAFFYNLFYFTFQHLLSICTTTILVCESDCSLHFFAQFFFGNVIWNKKEFPLEWIESNIVPIHKKGGNMVCNN
jgi:hypothetical protein